MTAALGVSRTVVREAVAVLRAEGLVETRQGVGAFVVRDVQRRPFRIDPDGLRSIGEVVEVMELRTGVEVEAAGIAAERTSPATRSRMTKALAAIDGAIARGEAAIDEDFAFHRAIAEATGNAHFMRFLEFLGRFLIPRQSVRVGRKTGRIDGPICAAYRASIARSRRQSAPAMLPRRAGRCDSICLAAGNATGG